MSYVPETVIVPAGTVGTLYGLGSTFAETPNISELSSTEGRQFAQARSRYVQGRILMPTVNDAAKALYTQAKAQFDAAFSDMQWSITLPFMTISADQAQALMTAEATFQRAIETDISGAVPTPPPPGPYTPPRQWFGTIPWWAWTGGALVLGLYVYSKVKRRLIRGNPSKGFRVVRSSARRGERKVLGPYTKSSAFQYARIASQGGRPYEVWKGQRRLRRYKGGKATYRAPGTEHPLSR